MGQGTKRRLSLISGRFCLLRVFRSHAISLLKFPPGGQGRNSRRACLLPSNLYRCHWWPNQHSLAWADVPKRSSVSILFEHFIPSQRNVSACLQRTRGSVQLSWALEEDRAATSDPGGQKADAACLLPHSTPTLPPGSDQFTTHPSLGCCSQKAPIPHWLWLSRLCTGSWRGRREKNFGQAAPHQSCNLSDRGVQTL